MYIKRHLEEEILNTSNAYPVIMVCGARQVGKSTMLYHIKEPARHYISLDDRNAKRLAENDPPLFFETYPPPLIIDEFQRVPSLLIEIKRIIDEKALRGEKNNGLFWLTGSQKFKMMKNVAETLAGRIAIFEMAGLSQSEINGQEKHLFSPDINTIKERQQLFSQYPKKTIKKIYENIFRGSMPKIISEHIDHNRYYMNYVNTYLERDIKDLSQIGKLNEFYDFLVYMAARTAQQLNYNDIANAIGVSAPTIKEWVSILERSGIIFILRPYFNNISKRLVKTPKIYFMDTGLAAYLCRWPNAQTLENGAMDGAFLETFVVSEIIKSYYNAGIEPNLFYYRDSDKKEIDLLFVNQNQVIPVEIKKAKTPQDAHKNFGVLEKINLQAQTGLVICATDELLPYNRQLWYYPLAWL